MSLKSAPYFWYECDCCGIKSTEDTDYAAWSDEQTAWDQADMGDFREVGGQHLCGVCWRSPSDDEARAAKSDDPVRAHTIHEQVDQ